MPLHGTSRSKIGYASLPKLPLPPTVSRPFMPARNWICSVSSCRPRRIQHANVCGHSSPVRSSGARERVLPVVKMKLRKLVVGEDFPRRQMSGDCLLKTISTDGGREFGKSEKESCGLLPHVMLALRRSYLHCSELVQCAAWAHPACGIATRQLAKRIVVPCK